MTTSPIPRPTHFLWKVDGAVGTITLNRPARKNPLTFESYVELTRHFDILAGGGTGVHAVIITGAGGNFCSGGDVHEIIGPLVQAKRAGDRARLLAFTKMTASLVRAMRHCPQPIVAAIDGVCAGAGAILAMASDIRLGTPRSRVAFLFTRVGLSGADMGACAMLPRIIGLGRASELLYTGRFMDAAEAERCGFYNSVVSDDSLMTEAETRARSLASGPVRAHAVTKSCLHSGFSMSIDDALDHEAAAQADCMMTDEFELAYESFVDRGPRTSGGGD
ncbi:MAG: enoyl-CoA hydratase family protein [Gemmatimonadota bacterium]